MKLETLKRHGDKKNSDFFEETLIEIYAHKENSGLQDLLGVMQGVVIQVQAEEGVTYCAELALMTPYRVHQVLMGSEHRVWVLKNSRETKKPVMVVIEPNKKTYTDVFVRKNSEYLRANEKPQVRYIGEIFLTQDLPKTVEMLSAQGVRVETSETHPFLGSNTSAVRWTNPSYYTGNCIGYSQKILHEVEDYSSMGWGAPSALSKDEQRTLKAAAEVQNASGITGKVLGIDHLATRVLSGNREDALLEMVMLSPYYFWGAYDITEQNSSTNITRMPGVVDELESPAKVFTANNTPWYTKALNGLPSPTEDFVRNFGARMHHMAYSVPDGKVKDGRQNIDYVVQTLDAHNVPFLARIFGECKDIPDLKQIFSKTSPYSFLITEYVQRCHNFEGFFTRGNVADLTAAAGEDAALRKKGIGGA